MPVTKRPIAQNWRIGEWTLNCYFVAVAALFALTTLFATVNFGWRQPLFDQWHEYEIYFGLPFPQNVLQEANGHRPIIPNLISVAEIHWLDANQVLQLIIGNLCAFLSALILAAVTWRDRSLPSVARCAGVMFAVFGVLWLANARRLLHGSEALHGYLPTLAALVASYFTYLAQHRGSIVWLAGACVASAVATFSFGLGLASFCSVVALGVLLRLPWRWLLLPLTTLATCLALYVVALPGNASVRGQLQLDWLESLRLLAQWISSPWFNGWLSLADPQANSLADSTTRLGGALAMSARGFVDATGVSTGAVCTALGLLGMAVFGICVLRYLARRDALRPLQALAIGSGIYALACAVITVLARITYFHTYPGQIYADRYLLWPSLFWCSLALLLLAPASGSRFVIVRGSAASFALALPAVLLVTQYDGAAWGSSVYRKAQATAAALRSGVYDQLVFTGIMEGRDVELREIDILRSHAAAMFADPTWRLLGTRWDGMLDTNSDLAVSIRWLPPIADTGTQQAGHIEGWITHGFSAIRPNMQLVVLDEQQTICGFGEFSFVTYPRALRLGIPDKQGFDAYIKHYDSARMYTLVSMDFVNNRALVLARINPSPVDAAGN